MAIRILPQTIRWVSSIAVSWEALCWNSNFAVLILELRYTHFEAIDMAGKGPLAKAYTWSVLEAYDFLDAGHWGDSVKPPNLHPRWIVDPLKIFKIKITRIKTTKYMLYFHI